MDLGGDGETTSLQQCKIMLEKLILKNVILLSFSCKPTVVCLNWPDWNKMSGKHYYKICLANEVGRQKSKLQS